MTDIATSDIHELCEQGQQALGATRYWEAQRLLTRAESQAWDARDFDAIARLYMPLQEARRQRRQRCGEGIVALDLAAEGPADQVDPHHVLANYPHGQLLVAGWGSIQPALRVRELAEQNGLYVETFLAAVFPAGSAGRVVVIVPTEDVSLPPVGSHDDIDALIRKLPPHCIVLPESQLPQGMRRGTAQTFSHVMELWEALHRPFMAAADMQVDPFARMEAYRRVIRVDYACELAHQKLSDVARDMDRARR